MIKYMDELRAIDLPREQYAVFGSGVLARHGIRENRDLEIIVTPELWEELTKTHAPYASKPFAVKLSEHIDACKDFFPGDDPTIFIQQADIHEGIRFVRIERMLDWKRRMARSKDLEDVQLIEGYLRKPS
jgi:hypothetical protein